MGAMKLPLILTNFKTYESAMGAKAVELAQLHEKVSLETGVSMAVAVQSTDIFRVASAVKIPVFAQHLDLVHFGSYTGHILAEAVKVSGAFGTLLNHSEHRLSLEVLKLSIQRAKEVGLVVVACAQDPEEGAVIAGFGPDFVAVEPPELIGGDISVATAKPEIIQVAVDLIGRGRVLVGAGVKNSKDIEIAIMLGASGVLLASGVTKAADPEAVLRDLAKGAHEA
ncbi:MAG: triose-phosphate isomerase [Candidatus Gracilibacteria bacterium]